MITFEFETHKPNVYNLIIKSDGEVVDILQRFDTRDERAAKIGLFAFVHPSYKHLNNSEIDRFLFC